MIYYLKRYLKPILIILGLIVLCLIGYVLYDKEEDVILEDEPIVKEELVEEKENIQTVFVEIKGAVNNPGVYELDEGKRIIDAINMAGGLLKNAYTKNLNLSKKLTDEMYIIVYTNYEINKYKEDNNKKENITEEIVCASSECICPDITNDACINESQKEEAKDEVTGKVSINNASKEELMTLTSIGESKANAIIKYREENNGFKNIEEIKNVSGIGDALFEKIKDNITL